jgi:tetratricopeptide (TPR) repeat protein
MNKKYNNMRSKIVIIGIIGMLLTSCGEDFLNVPSQVNLTDGVYFKTENDLRAAINAVYSNLRTLYGNAYIMGESHSDNGRYLINPLYRAGIDQEDVVDFMNVPANSVSTGKYRQNYSMIAKTNKVLASVDGATISSELLRDNIKGQAYCLRAFAYFDLVQYFGSVPLHITPVTTYEGTALPLASVEDVYAQIISDLTEAIALLPVRSAQTDLGRVTKGTAQMILGNVYMVQEDYAAAETVLKAIVNSGEYKLVNDYATVFNPAQKNNSESIFEVQFRAGTDGYSSSFVYNMLPQPMVLDTVRKLTGVTDPQPLQGSEAYLIPSPDILAAYEPGDLRYGASVGVASTFYNAVSTSYPICKKYLHPHSMLNNSNDNWPVYRYAEVLLFLAEAINEQSASRTAEALTYINDAIGTSTVSIRERAGLADVVAADQAAARAAIAQERRIELAFENKRWLDLVRTGQAVSVMTAYGAAVHANETAYYFPAGWHIPTSAFAAINLLFPLPADEALYSPYF